MVKQVVQVDHKQKLQAGRILLRRPTMADALHVFHWERDDEVWRYDPFRPYSNSLTEFLPNFSRNYIRGNGRQFWFIIENEARMPIGTITYFNIDYRVGQIEVGLGLGNRAQWGKGYGSEAIALLSQYLLTQPGVTRIYAETAHANLAARRSFLRAQFREVGPILDPRRSGAPWILLERCAEKNKLLKPK